MAKVTSRTRIVFTAAVALAAASFSFSFAQQTPARTTDDQKPVETLKVNVNVVQLFFNVKDKKGGLIPNLTKDDFEIYEDGKPQTVKYFTAESNLPLTLGIMIDSSGSQRNVLDMEKEVGGAFLKQILTDKDEAYVISFDVTVDLLQDFTRDVHRLQAALNKAKINTGFTSGTPLPGAGGEPVPIRNPAGTLLFDAVYLSAHDMLAKEVGRKAMILLTDGQDEGSKLKVQDAIEAGERDSVYQLRRSYVRENKSGVCFTLMANMGDGGHNMPVIRDRWGIRKLTQKECLRLQGIDAEDFVFPPDLSRSQQYKQIGNAVTVPLARKLADECRRLLSPIGVRAEG